MNKPLHFALTAAILTSSLFAQTGSVTVSTTLRPKSVHPTYGGQVVCSMVDSGRLVTIDASTVSSPSVVGTPYNPTFSDQFGDAYWSPQFNGRLIAAYRWGGINYIETGAAPAYTVLDSQPTTYHHEGLDVHDTPIGSYVAYSEQNTSSGNAGGLRIYSMGFTNLNQVGSVLTNDEGGNDLEFSRYGRRIFQLGEIGGPNNVRFWEYNSDSGNGFINPTRVVDMPFPGAITRHSSSRVEINGKGSNLLITRGYEGLHAGDITIPFSPVINTYIQLPNLYFDGVRFYPNSNIAIVWGHLKVGTTYTDFLFFVEASIPGVVIPIGIMTYPLAVTDVQIKSGTVFVLGTDRASGDAILHTW